MTKFNFKDLLFWDVNGNIKYEALKDFLDHHTIEDLYECESYIHQDSLYPNKKVMELLFNKGFSINFINKSDYILSEITSNYSDEVYDLYLSHGLTYEHVNDINSIIFPNITYQRFNRLNNDKKLKVKEFDYLRIAPILFKSNDLDIQKWIIEGLNYPKIKLKHIETLTYYFYKGKKFIPHINSLHHHQIRIKEIIQKGLLEKTDFPKEVIESIFIPSIESKDDIVKCLKIGTTIDQLFEKISDQLMINDKTELIQDMIDLGLNLKQKRKFKRKLSEYSFQVIELLNKNGYPFDHDSDKEKMLILRACLGKNNKEKFNSLIKMWKYTIEDLYDFSQNIINVFNRL